MKTDLIDETEPVARHGSGRGLALSLGMIVFVATLAVSACTTAPGLGGDPPDTRPLDGVVIFRQCLDNNCAPEANETSLRVKDMAITSSAWPWVHYRGNGTVRFAHDPATGRAASSFRTFTDVSLNVENGQFTFSTGLAEPWVDALGIPGLDLDELALDGASTPAGVQFDLTSTVSIADFVTSQLQGTMALTSGVLSIDVSSTADVALLGHVFTDTQMSVTPGGLHIDGDIGLTDIGTVSVVGDVALGSGVVRYDLLAGLDITAAGFDLEVPEVTLSGTVGLTPNSIPFAGLIDIRDIGTATVTGALEVDNGTPRLNLSGSAGQLNVGGLDFAATADVAVALADGRISVDGEAMIEGIASIAASGQLWADDSGVHYDITGSTTVDVAGFPLNLPALRFTGTTSLDPAAVTTNAQFDVSGLGVIDVSATLTLTATPALDVSFDSGSLEIAGFTVDAGGAASITEVNGRLNVVGNGEVDGLGSLGLDGEFWNDPLSGVSFDFDVSGNITAGGFNIPISPTNVAGTVGGSGHSIVVDTSLQLGSAGAVDLVGTLDLDTATLDIQGSGSVDIEGFTIAAQSATSVQLRPDGVHIAGEASVPGVGAIDLDGRIWVAPAGISYDFVATSAEFSLGGFDFEAMTMRIDGILDIAVGEDGITLSGKTRIGDPADTSTAVDVTGRFWNDAGAINYDIDGTGGLALAGWPIAAAMFDLDGVIGNAIVADIDAELSVLGLAENLAIVGTISPVQAPDGEFGLEFDTTVSADRIVLAGFPVEDISFPLAGDVSVDQTAAGLNINGRLKLLDPTFVDVSGTMRVAGDTTHYSLTGAVGLNLHFFEVTLPSVNLTGTLGATVSSDGVDVNGTMDLGLTTVSLGGRFTADATGVHYTLTGTAPTFSVLGFQLQNTAFTVNDSAGVSATTTIGIPGLPSTNYSGRFWKNTLHGPVNYSLSGTTAVSFSGIGTIASLTLDNAGMHMSTHLGLGGWLNASFNGLVASNGSYNMTAANGLNLGSASGLPLVGATSSVTLSSSSGLTAQVSTSVGGLGVMTMTGSISSAGMNLYARAPQSGFFGGCVEGPTGAAQARACFETYSELRLGTAGGLNFGIGGGGSAYVESRACGYVPFPWSPWTCTSWGARVGASLQLTTWADASNVIHQDACTQVSPFPELCIRLW